MTTLQMFVDDCRKGAQVFYSQVIQRVNDARNCYIKDSTEQYDDATFAQMMVLDACFIIVSIVEDFEFRQFGELESTMIFRDIILLENQIPFWLLKLLICSGYGQEKGEKILNEFLYDACLGEYKGSGMSLPDGELSHLLGVCWLILFPKSPQQSTTPESRPSDHLPPKYTCSLPCFPGSRRDDNDQSIKKYIYSFRSAMDLKAKGIHFRPSNADSLNGIKFKSGYFYARLEVPIWIVTSCTKIFFLNMIAYEMCSKTSQDQAAMAYIEFMKSLIDSPKDVKELREKRILLTTLGSDEEVLKVYKEIKTYELEDVTVFHNVKKEIEAHYNNKAKTWLAELLYTNFRSPWAAIALFATAFLLVLAFLQTFYTIRPR